MIRFRKGSLGLFACSLPGCGEQPTAPVGSDAWRFASAVAGAPICEDLTRERPTVAISIDVEHWAGMASPPSEQRAQVSAAICCGLRLPSYQILAATSAVLLSSPPTENAW